MGKRKKFPAKRKPEYWVITKFQPERIDGISLKFRDLHIVHRIMLDYTLKYVEVIEAVRPREEGRLDFNAPLTANEQSNQDLIRVMLAAHLSIYETILYYLSDRISQSGKQWLASLRRTDGTLSAFDRLRNRDVHHEAMHTLIGMRFRILSSDAPYSSIDTKEIHFHGLLLHEGAGFYPPPVAETEQFKKHPGLVQLVTFESILQLAHRVIHRLADLLNEASARGFWAAPHENFRCELCLSGENSSEG